MTDVGLNDSVTFQNGAEKHLRAADVLWIHKVEIHKVEGTWLPGTGMHTCTHHIRVQISNRAYPGTRTR